MEPRIRLGLKIATYLSMHLMNERRTWCPKWPCVWALVPIRTMGKQKIIRQSFFGFISCFLISFHQGPEPGCPQVKPNCCTSLYKYTFWKQDSYNPRKCLETEHCKFRRSFQYLEREWKFSWGCKSLSQNFLLEGRGEREGRGREERGGREEGVKTGKGRGVEGQTETENFPESPEGLNLDCPWESPRKLLKSADAWTASPQAVIYLIWGYGPSTCFQSSTGDSNARSGLKTTKLAVLESWPSRWKRKSQRQRQPSTWQWRRLGTALYSLCTRVFAFNLSSERGPGCAILFVCSLSIKTQKPRSVWCKRAPFLGQTESCRQRAHCLGFKNFLAGPYFHFLEISNLLLKCIIK